MRIVFALLAGLALVSTQAIAADAPKAAAKPEMKGDMKKMEAPKPAPEMEAMTKAMVGKWTCTGKMKMPADMGGGTMDTKGTITWRSDLKGFALVGTDKMEASKGMPGGEMTHTIAYDPTGKEFRQMMMDDMGSLCMATSKGVEGDKQVWLGEGTMMGKTMKMRMTHTMKSAKEVTLVHETDMGDGKWIAMGEDTCKK